MRAAGGKKLAEWALGILDAESGFGGSGEGSSWGFWRSAESPPAGEAGKWSRQVVVVMASGEVRRLSYFHSDDAKSRGLWQRPQGLTAGDKPLWWSDFPNGISTSE